MPNPIEIKSTTQLIAVFGDPRKHSFMSRSPIQALVDQACGISPAEIQRMQKEAAELADAQTAALLALEKSARLWWRQRRPVGWTKRKHLANPTVNCNGKDEIRLAQMVANWINLGG